MMEEKSICHEGKTNFVFGPNCSQAICYILATTAPEGDSNREEAAGTDDTCNTLRPEEKRDAMHVIRESRRTTHPANVTVCSYQFRER